MRERALEILKLLDRGAGIPAVYGLAALQAAISLFLPPRKIRIRSILMAKLWGAGNLVMIMPLIRAVRRAYPGAHIRFFTLDENAELLRAMPELDGITVLKAKGAVRTLASLAALPFRLRRLKPDLFLDFEQFLRITPILGLLSGAAQRVGLNTPGQARARLYNIKVPYRLDRHMTRTFGDVVRSAGIDIAGFPALEVPRSRAAGERVDAILKSGPQGGGPLVVIHPGSGDNFPARRWPVQHFAAVAGVLHAAAQARIVITGTARERPLGRLFGAACPAPFRDLMGLSTLPELVELLARADLVITNDTAPVHIAAALDRPLIALYGPNTPDLYGPLNKEAVAFYLRFPCSPCITNLNAKTSRCQVPACIQQIDPERVAAAALKLLARRQGAAPARAATQSGQEVRP